MKRILCLVIVMGLIVSVAPVAFATQQDEMSVPISFQNSINTTIIQWFLDFYQF